MLIAAPFDGVRKDFIAKLMGLRSMVIIEDLIEVGLVQEYNNGTVTLQTIIRNLVKSELEPDSDNCAPLIASIRAVCVNEALDIVAYLTPYINEFTIDIIPQASFSPVLGEYLKDVPVLVKNSDAFKETLCHRRKTLSANGLKIHLENSTFTKDVLLKEIYHNGAIVCLYRIETSQGETAGFYNTQTKQFVSMFTHTEEQTTLLGNYIENTILWC